MKKAICILAILLLLPACGDKQTQGTKATQEIQPTPAKTIISSYAAEQIPRDGWSRTEIADILEQAKAMKNLSKSFFNEWQIKNFPQNLRQAELSFVFPLIQAGMRKEDVLAIVGEPNNTSLSGGPWYHLHMYMTHLNYKEGVLVDSIKDLYRRAGSKYSEVSRVRALQRLAEIRPIREADEFFDGWDLGIQTTRALAMLHDPNAMPILIDASKKAAHLVGGSESATIHGIYQQTLANALERLTGLPSQLDQWKGQDPDGLRRTAAKAESWWQKNKESILSPPPDNWGPVAEGLKMRIALDKEEYAVGSSPNIIVGIRNQTDKPVKLCRHPAFLTRCLTDRHGVAVPRRTEFITFDPKLPTVKDSVTIKPGCILKWKLGEADEVIEGGYRSALWHISQVPQKPGVYCIRVHYCAVDAYANATLGDVWTGVLTSNVLQVEFLK